MYPATKITPSQIITRRDAANGGVGGGGGGGGGGEGGGPLYASDEEVAYTFHTLLVAM